MIDQDFLLKVIGKQQVMIEHLQAQVRQHDRTRSAANGSQTEPSPREQTTATS